MAALHDPQATPIKALQMSGDAKALAVCMSALPRGNPRQVVRCPLALANACSTRTIRASTS